MSRPKPLATLTPTLLARKGGAKPAMRSQLQPLHEFQAMAAIEPEDDLGWNDMGDDAAQVGDGAEILSLAGEPLRDKQAQPTSVLDEQRANHAGRVATGRRPAGVKPARRVAFTLRLDPERHLRLRLASAVMHRSAQNIVAEALDNHLASMAEIEALAARIRDGR
ncbi:MAG: hypothetical protein N2423_01510 [Novosphingobium sp.]|nr:hypothetical protein [Novosphingobium sp.]